MTKKTETKIALTKKCILALKNCVIRYIIKQTVIQHAVKIKPSIPYYDLEPLFINYGKPSCARPIKGIFLDLV